MLNVCLFVSFFVCLFVCLFVAREYGHWGGTEKIKQSGVKMKMAKLSGTKIVGQDIDGDGQ